MKIRRIKKEPRLLDEAIEELRKLRIPPKVDKIQHGEKDDVQWFAYPKERFCVAINKGFPYLSVSRYWPSGRIGEWDFVSELFLQEHECDLLELKNWDHLHILKKAMEHL